MPLTLRWLLIPCAALIAGCEMQQYGTFTRDVDIAGGETLKVSFEYGMPVPAQNDDARVVIASLKPANGGLYQLFSFLEKKGRLPRRVTVEDVAGETAELFVDDLHPKFLVDPRAPDKKTYTWSWISPSLESIGWKPAWLHEPDESVRMYRFTIVADDGRTIVLYQATRYPAVVKEAILKTLGNDRPAKDESVEEIHL
jgi:hypothetical protein